MTSGNPTKGDAQDWMSCAAPLSNKQSKEFHLASTNCVGKYGKRNRREVKSKNKARNSAAELRLKNLPDTAKGFWAAELFI
jgi:hypothetical protein